MAKGDITEKEVDQLHQTFMNEIERLFERTKTKHGYKDSDKLTIL